MVEVYLSGALHGDERIGPATVTEMATLLVQEYGKNEDLTWLMDSRSIWVPEAALGCK